MYRDFTYIDDLVYGIKLLIDTAHLKIKISQLRQPPVAPYRVVNIGNSNKINLIDFVDAIEDILKKKAIRNYMPMQKGDVKATWSDSSLLKNLTNYSPKTNFRDGVLKFIEWYREYYNVQFQDLTNTKIFILVPWL